MIAFNVLYLVIPFIFYAFGGVILAIFSRNKGSLSTSFYRQFTIFLVGLPILYFVPIELEILKENIKTICITSMIGASYLFLLFKSYDYIPVAIGNAFALASKVIATILMGFVLLGDSVNNYQWITIFFLILSILSLLKVKEKFTNMGVFLSILSGFLFVINWYYFVQYSVNFNPLIAGYILEVFNGIFLFLFLFLKSLGKKNYLKKIFKIDKKTFLITLSVAPITLIASGVLAKSYEIYSFTIVGISLTMVLPATIIFGWFILKEKLTLKTIISILLITLCVIVIKFLEG